MFKKLAVLMLVVGVLGLSACVPGAGRRVDRTHINDIQTGVQDKAQIKAWFGEPYVIIPNLEGHPKGCTERWSFEYAIMRGTIKKYIYQEMLIVDFDKDGKVCDHAFSEKNINK